MKTLNHVELENSKYTKETSFATHVIIEKLRKHKAVPSEKAIKYESLKLVKKSFSTWLSLSSVFTVTCIAIVH